MLQGQTGSCGIASTPSAVRAIGKSAELGWGHGHVACLVTVAHSQVQRISTSKTEANGPPGFCVQAEASFRDGDIFYWQETWTDTALHGYRRGRRAADVWTGLSQSVEFALVGGSYLMVGRSTGANVFDRFPQ